MTRRSTNGDGLRLSDPIETAVPAPAPVVVAADEWEDWVAANKCEDWQVWVVETVGETVAAMRAETARAIEKRIEPLVRALAEQSGALSVLRNLGPPPGIRFRGSYDPNAEYFVNDVVAKNGSSFVAPRDRPGACPGEFWQLLAGKGDQGQVGPAGPRGEEGPPGKLPLVKLWMPETVYYQGDVVAHDGGTFQAMCDTGQPPSHAHWICLATAGRDGKTIAVRGTFDESVSYRRLDVVALNGGSFIALKDAPGPCPGPGWQLIASQGRRGAAGEKGERGSPGPKGDAGASGTTIRDWKIDRTRYAATPVMSDGRDGPPLELRGLFEQFLKDAG
jgi:hypothetical protein